MTTRVASFDVHKQSITIAVLEGSEIVEPPTRWDFSAHEEWVMGETHYFFGSGLRVPVRIAGVAIAAVILRRAWIDARELDHRMPPKWADDHEDDRPIAAGRRFVPGKRPRWDE
jgi:hypothetical protein